MPTTYTESKCDACPRAWAGVFIHNGGRLTGHRTPATHACPSGAIPAWGIESSDKDCPPSFTLAERVTEVPDGVTMLLGCGSCGKSCPCLLEITGPAEKLPCLVFDGVPAEWFRVTS